MDVAFAHHLSLDYLGGGEKWLINLAKELVHRGHTVSIHALPFKLKGKVDKHQHEALGSIPYKEQYFHNINADVVYVTYHPLSFLNYFTKAPRIAGLHAQVYNNNLTSNYGLLPNLAKIANSLVGKFDLKTYTAIHMLTNDSWWHLPNRQIYQIPNFVDSSFYKPSKKDSEFTVVFASRKVWQKGYDIWKDVSRMLTNNKVNCVESNNIPEKDMPSFYSKAHVTVAPARSDTFGLTLVESLMCGTPVITTSTLSHKRLNAKLIYANHPTTIVREVMKLKTLYETDTKGYNTLCSNGRKSVMGYDKEIIIDKLESMLKNVAS